MEKFGIFELLDTLSALILPDPPAPAPPAAEKPKPDDAAFAPPHYGGEPQRPSSAAALSSFLEKHEKAVKKVDGDK